MRRLDLSEEAQRLAASIAEHELIVASLKTSHEQASESLREQFAREKEAMLVNYGEAEKYLSGSRREE